MAALFCRKNNRIFVEKYYIWDFDGIYIKA